MKWLLAVVPAVSTMATIFCWGACQDFAMKVWACISVLSLLVMQIFLDEFSKEG